MTSKTTTHKETKEIKIMKTKYYWVALLASAALIGQAQGGGNPGGGGGMGGGPGGRYHGPSYPGAACSARLLQRSSRWNLRSDDARCGGKISDRQAARGNRESFAGHSAVTRSAAGCKLLTRSAITR